MPRIAKPKMHNRQYVAYFPDGTMNAHTYHKDDELEILQGLVGGYIEAVNRKTLTINNVAFKELSSGKKLYMNDNRAGLPENPHFTITQRQLRPDAPAELTYETYKRFSEEVASPLFGVVVSVQNF